MNNADSNTLFCDRCYIGCLTCTGPLATSCLSCSDNFTFNSNTSACIPPSTSSDYTIQQVYYFMGFNAVSNWSPTGVITCYQTTLLGLTSGTYTVGFTSLPNHYAVRVMFAHYLSIGLAGSVTTNIQIGYDGTYKNTPVSVSTANSNNPQLNCVAPLGYWASFVQTYVDSSASHTSSSINIGITTSGSTFGLREVIIILKLCNGVCTACNGYYP
jgi:hypothetical protein